MDTLNISDTAARVHRASCRVKNAGNVSLYRKGLKIAQQIKLQSSEKEATRLEWAFTEILRHQYGINLAWILNQPAVMNTNGYEPSDGEEHFSVKDDSVEIPDNIKDDVSDIANDYHDETGQDIVITDGSRDASDQAEAMFEKLQSGDDVNKLYLNQEALEQIKEAYNNGVNAGKSDEDIINDMTDVISQQINDGTFISKHLTGNAVDVRITDMTPEQQAAFRKAAEGKGAKVILEGKPPHFHVQF